MNNYNREVIDHKTVDRGTKVDEIYDCDICGFTWPKVELIRQDGLRVCKYCWDEPRDSKRR